MFVNAAVVKVIRHVVTSLLLVLENGKSWREIDEDFLKIKTKLIIRKYSGLPIRVSLPELFVLYEINAVELLSAHIGFHDNL